MKEKPPKKEVKIREVKGKNGKVRKQKEIRIKELNNHGIKTEIYKPI